MNNAAQRCGESNRFDCGADHQVLGGIPGRHVVGLLPGEVDLRLAASLQTADPDIAYHADDGTVMISKIKVTAERVLVWPIALHEGRTYDSDPRCAVNIHLADVTARE